MDFNRRCVLLLVVLGALSSLAGCATLDGRPMVPLRVPPSHGDGDFRDISWRYPWPSLPVGLPVPGYVVKFPAFNLGEEYDKEFVVTDLHDIQQKVGVYLYLPAPWGTATSDADRRRLRAEFAFEVLDADGRVIAQTRKQLGELVWSTPSGIDRGDGASLYSFEDSFHVQKTQRYTIRVHYRPDASLRDLQGFVYLRCRGSI